MESPKEEDDLRSALATMQFLSACSMTARNGFSITNYPPTRNPRSMRLPTKRGT